MSRLPYLFLSRWAARLVTQLALVYGALVNVDAQASLGWLAMFPGVVWLDHMGVLFIRGTKDVIC